jgi:hypothetical protein
MLEIARQPNLRLCGVVVMLLFLSFLASGKIGRT